MNILAHLSLSARVNPTGCFAANKICEGLVGMLELEDEEDDDAVVGEGP